MLLPLIVGSAAFMQTFDGSAVVVALPSIAAGFALALLACSLSGQPNVLIASRFEGAAGSVPASRRPHHCSERCAQSGFRSGDGAPDNAADAGPMLGPLIAGLIVIGSS